MKKPLVLLAAFAALTIGLIAVYVYAPSESTIPVSADEVILTDAERAFAQHFADSLNLPVDRILAEVREAKVRPLPSQVSGTMGASCASGDYNCQAAMACYGFSVSGWGAQNQCSAGNTGICTAWRWATGDPYFVSCGSS